jgi:hypothetical protein
MSPSITLKGHVKFSVKKIIAGGELASSTFTGPGELILAPASLGDITSIRLSGNETWSVGKHAYLAYTQGINKDYKRQGLGKAIFSGEGLFIYKITGTGLLWISSFGAIIRKDVSLKAQCPLCRCHDIDLGIIACARRKVYRRQRPPCSVEHKLCLGACRLRRHHFRLVFRRRPCLQVYRPWHCLHAD